MWLTLITGAIKALGLLDDVERWIDDQRLIQQGQQKQQTADLAASVSGDMASARADDSVRALDDSALDERLRQSIGDPAS